MSAEPTGILKLTVFPCENGDVSVEDEVFQNALPPVSDVLDETPVAKVLSVDHWIW